MIIHVRGDVIKLKGSLLENYWLALKSAVTLLLKEHPSGVIIDGSELTEIDEAGAHTFLDASNYIQAHRARVVISGMPENILEEIRRIPGVRSQLPICPTVEEARASLAVGGEETVPEIRRKPAVLVPLLGSWRRVLIPAAIQAAAMKGEVHLLYVLEVPRALPIGVPLPDEEHKAQETLSEAERILKGHGAPVRKLITRAREPIEGAGKFAADLSPRLMFVSYAKEELEVEGRACESVGTLCHEIPGSLVVFCWVDSVAPEGTREEECKAAVLVPLFSLWPKALEFAAVHATSRKVEVHLVYPLQVPRTLPLDASLPDQEQEAEQTLSEAERALKRFGVRARKFTTRVRDVVEGIGKYASETKPQMLVVAHYKPDLENESSRHALICTFCHEAPCDAAIICATE